MGGPTTRRRSIRQACGGRLLTALWPLLFVGIVHAANQNEVSAVLVFPTVLSESTELDEPLVETLIAIANPTPLAVDLTLLFLNGESCEACPLQGLSVAGQGEVTLVFSRLHSSGETRIQTLDGTVTTTCPGGNGFAVVFDESGGQPGTDNLLIGNSLVVDYAAGSSFSVPAVVAQGFGSTGDGSFSLRFDDQHYSRWPRRIAGNFFAPGPDTRYEARLSLFTLGFNSGTPPTVRCSIGGQDANGGQIGGGLFQETFEVTLLFGCWADVDLRELAPEFGYPKLGAQGFDEHGGIQIDCEVDSDGDGSFDADGGVHGAMVQTAEAGTTLLERGGGAQARSSGQQPVASAVAWARLLNQSVTTGDPVTFTVEGCNGLDDDDDGEIDEGCDDDDDGYCDARLLAGAVAPICTSGFGDCDDANTSIFPGADEVCDGLDNDCDGAVDEDPANPPTWYADADGDGFGDPATGVVGCAQPAGSVADGTDCDDTDPTVFAVPHEIQNVRVAPSGVVSWDSDAPSSGSATVYDVLRGVTRDLPVQGADTESCLRPAPGTSTSVTDPDEPPPSGFYYLVRGRNACGVGSYGEGRTSPACP